MVESQLVCMPLSTQLLDQITHRKHIIIGEITFSFVHRIMCAPYDTRTIFCARLMVCSRHISAPTHTERDSVTLNTIVGV